MHHDHNPSHRPIAIGGVLLHNVAGKYLPESVMNAANGWAKWGVKMGASTIKSAGDGIYGVLDRRGWFPPLKPGPAV